MRPLDLLFALLLAWPAVLGLALVALAADPAATRVGDGCYSYRLCDAEDDGTAACDNGTANIVLGGPVRIYSFAAGASTATAFSCTCYTSGIGYHATKKTAIASALTESNYVQSLDGAVPDAWCECGAPTGGTVTIDLLACPVSK